jgi:hypothetical protein
MDNSNNGLVHLGGTFTNCFHQSILVFQRMVLGFIHNDIWYLVSITMEFFSWVWIFQRRSHHNSRQIYIYIHIYLCGSRLII